MADLGTIEAEKMLAGIVIPPRPNIVTAILNERNQREPDQRKVAQLISTDVSLAAAVLKTINSPLYGLTRKVSSIDQAVSMLGMNTVFTLVVGLALRNAVPAKGLERFWDGATRTALITAHLAKLLGSVNKDEAHLFGLFQNCGIPLMMQRFPEYKETLRLGNNERDLAFTAIEDQLHNTNHAIVGNLLATNWNQSETMRDAIRLHHDLDVYHSNLPPAVLNLIALGHLSGYIENAYSRLMGDHEWDKFGTACITHLMLDEQSLKDLQRDASDLLEESGI